MMMMIIRLVISRVFRDGDHLLCCQRASDVHLRLYLGLSEMVMCRTSDADQNLSFIPTHSLQRIPGKYS